MPGAGGRRTLPDREGAGDNFGDAPEFPVPPEKIPDWADKEAAMWRGLGNFDLEVRAEERSGLVVEIRQTPLPESVWGMHIARGKRVRLCVNSSLPRVWRRFALFHELYHLIAHTEGEYFWSQTFNPISRFESEADMFAWAAIWPEWTEGE
ncbi:MAG: ImmA/IrrE family metallo-endopeptidase [Synergistaceae bacterium]|nr:ImmA/IrrE family metallo-endopeptidase [Synergistaceae bacterium]